MLGLTLKGLDRGVFGGFLRVGFSGLFFGVSRNGNFGRERSTGTAEEGTLVPVAASLHGEPFEGLTNLNEYRHERAACAVHYTDEVLWRYCPVCGDGLRLERITVHSHGFDGAVDIAEAGACLATLRATASVFHSMRVLERGLAALGAIFGVSLVNTNWGVAIEQIENRIREMHKDATWKLRPDCKALQVKYAQAASTFGILKDAWRNYTMHGHSTYTQEEAEQILLNTRTIMQKLVDLGLKE